MHFQILFVYGIVIECPHECGQCTHHINPSAAPGHCLVAIRGLHFWLLVSYLDPMHSQLAPPLTKQLPPPLFVFIKYIHVKHASVKH